MAVIILIRRVVRKDRVKQFEAKYVAEGIALTDWFLANVNAKAVEGEIRAAVAESETAKNSK